MLQRFPLPLHHTHREKQVFMDEQQLVAGCKRGDAQARRVLYEQYAPAMLSLCVRYVHDQETARDLLQDGFVKVFTKIETYSAKGPLGAWIRRVFVTTALEYLRKYDALRSSVPLDEYEEQVEDPDASVLDRLSADDLLACVSRLPEGYRTVFNLYALEGLYAQRDCFFVAYRGDYFPLAILAGAEGVAGNGTDIHGGEKWQQTEKIESSWILSA